MSGIDRALTQEECIIENFLDYVENLEKLCSSQKDLIESYKNWEQLYKQQYEVLNKILLLEDDDEKIKQLDDYHTTVVYVNKNRKHKDEVFENILWVLRNSLQFENSYWKFKRLEYREENLYPMIKENIIKCLKNHEIINKKNNPKHNPDMWLRNNMQEIPVEVKKFEFGRVALKQLLRYMKFYKCDKGIAVAKKLIVELPENIRFISIEELEELNK